MNQVRSGSVSGSGIGRRGRRASLIPRPETEHNRALDEEGDSNGEDNRDACCDENGGLRGDWGDPEARGQDLSSLGSATAESEEEDVDAHLLVARRQNTALTAR